MFLLGAKHFQREQSVTLNRKQLFYAGVVLCLFLLTGSRVPLLKTPIPASYIAVEEAVCVIRERCYRDDQTPVFKSEQFR